VLSCRNPFDEAVAKRAESHEVLLMTAPLMSASEASNLPSGWYANEIAGRGVDLRVSAPLRGYAVAVSAILATLAGWKAMVQWPVKRGYCALVGTHSIPECAGALACFRG